MPGVSGHRSKIGRVGSIWPKVNHFYCQTEPHTFQWLVLTLRQETGLNAGQQKLQKGSGEGRRARGWFFQDSFVVSYFPGKHEGLILYALRKRPLCAVTMPPKILSQRKPACCWQSLSNYAPASYINERERGYFVSVREREVAPFTLKHPQPKLPSSISSLSGAIGKNENGKLFGILPAHLAVSKNPTSLHSLSFDCHWGFCLPGNTFLPICTRSDILAKQLFFSWWRKESDTIAAFCHRWSKWTTNLNLARTARTFCREWKVQH